MGWKNWSYWLRGGIISVIIYLILLLITFLCAENASGEGFVCLLFFVPTLLLMPLYQAIFGYPEPVYLAYVFFVIFWFVIGAVVGLIIGKIKRRKMKNA